MGAGEIIAGVIKAVIQPVFDSVGKAINRVKTERGIRQTAQAQIPYIEDSIEKIKEMYAQNEIDEDQAIQELTDIFNSTRGEIKTALNNSLKIGIQTINENTSRAVDAIRFQISEAKEEAGFQEKKELERLDKQMADVKDMFQESNQELRKSFTKRGLGASGAMISAFRKAKEGFGEVSFRLREQSDDVLENIRRGLAATRRGGMFQQRQLGEAAGTQARQLTSDIGTQLAQQLARLGMSEVQQKQAARQYYGEVGRELNAEEIAMENLLGQKMGESTFATTPKGKREAEEWETKYGTTKHFEGINKEIQEEFGGG